jgi:hypothetical protein
MSSRSRRRGSESPGDRRQGRSHTQSFVPSATPIAFHLTAIPEAERPRYFTLRAQVLATVESVAEIEDGYALHVGADLVALAEWIAFERKCCPFLSFRLAIEGGGPVRLELGGADGVKDFLREEFGSFGGAPLVSAASLVRGR